MRLSFALVVCCAAVGGCDRGQPAPSASAKAIKALPEPEPTPEPVPEQEREPASRIALPPEFQGVPERTLAFKNGLLVEDFVLGQGRSALVGSKLTLRYAGFLDDGRKFDDNRAPGQPPFRFRLPSRPRVLGWGQGLLGMRAGGKRKIVVPPELGYGKAGDPGDEGEVSVPPNAKLTYVVELLEVQDPPARPKGLSAFSGRPLTTKRLRGGLLVQDFQQGSGEPVTTGDRVKIHYSGMLADGTVFDRTSGGDSPFEFVVGHRSFIAGWNQGLLGMRVGGLRKLKIPPKLGYGKRGSSKVPPNATLVFMVELMGLEKAPPKKKAQR